MPFSHHSHSGQFCGHATNTLEEVIQDAIAKGMTTFCTTEHIPRDQIDFYEEEIDVHTPETLRKLFDDYYHEARRLQKVYNDEIDIFIGFESEWIRDSTFKIMEGLLKEYEFDLFVGSIHHVHTIPIDMDFARYHRARDVSGGEDRMILEDYLDAQFSMLKALRPPVVGHFDLIRLRSDDSDGNMRDSGGDCWEKVERNLKFMVTYGAVMELNSSSLRKGMREVYPQVEICKEFLALGGRFTLSDDSHGISQVGLNYGKALECVKQARITELHYLTSVSETIKAHDSRFPKVGWKAVSVEELEKHPFWKKSKLVLDSRYLTSK